MAYNNFLASVPEAEVARLRENASVLLRPSQVWGVSHLLATVVDVQPLCGLLRRALDGGNLIRPELWHPLRPPLVHDPAVVAELAEQVAAVATGTFADDGWLEMEVSRLLRLFQHASGSGECVVSALDLPADAERASRVRQLWRWE